MTFTTLTMRLTSIEEKLTLIIEVLRMHPAIEAKFNELDQTIVDETTELKSLAVAGGTPTEINARIDTAIAAIKNMSDAVFPVNPPTG